MILTDLADSMMKSSKRMERLSSKRVTIVINDSVIDEDHEKKHKCYIIL